MKTPFYHLGNAFMSAGVRGLAECICGDDPRAAAGSQPGP